MELKNFEFTSEFAKKHIALGRSEGVALGRTEGVALGRSEGMALGRAEAVLSILVKRGVTVPDALRERLLACRESDVLDRWLGRALTAQTAEEVIN